MKNPTAVIDFANPRNTTGKRLRAAFSEPKKWITVRYTQHATHSQKRTELLNAINEAFDEAQHHNKWVVGAIKYEAASFINPIFKTAKHLKDNDELAWFAVFDKAHEFNDLNDLNPDTPKQPSTSAEEKLSYASEIELSEFQKNIKIIQSRIEQGEFYQINYTANLVGELAVRAPIKTQSQVALSVFKALQRAQPNGYTCYFDVGSEQFASVSPELFFDWLPSGDMLTRPMKGTAARSKIPEEDAFLKQQLQSSIKDRAENVMIVDLLRNDLSKIAIPHSVKADHLFHVQALPSVWQMTSDVTAITKAGIHLSDIFTALFPCGSVTGTPKKQAMLAIDELEKSDRGIYCGALGVIRPGGHATFNVPIRTVSLKNHSMRCGIGSAIVKDSTAEGEWSEWKHKQAFLDRASEPFSILDSLALNEGVITHLEQHMERMADALEHFNFPACAHQLRSQLNALAANKSVGSWRIRVTISSEGLIELQTLALTQTANPVTLQLAATPLLHTQSEFVRFKTTRRAHYEAFTPHVPNIFDTILWNENEEVTECTRGNLAIELDGKWLTPALSCGLLNGIGRQMALKTGRVSEALIHTSQLARAKNIAFLNDTRGWLSAVMVTANQNEQTE